MSKPLFDQVRQLRKGQFLVDCGEALRPEQVVEDTAQAIVEKLKTGTGFPVLFGKP